MWFPRESQVSTDASPVRPSGGPEELPGLCSLYLGPSAQELARGPSQTGCWASSLGSPCANSLDGQVMPHQGSTHSG